MTKDEINMVPDEAWNALMDNRSMHAMNILRDKMPFLGLVGAKNLMDKMKIELGMKVYNASEVLR